VTTYRLFSIAVIREVGHLITLAYHICRVLLRAVVAAIRPSTPRMSRSSCYAISLRSSIARKANPAFDLRTG
jgi:hypothetical protein